MGDRAQVKVIMGEGEPDVYLYTHEGGSELEEVVRKAMARRQRWNQPEYLARKIFCEMLFSSYKTLDYMLSDELGYGIGTTQHGDINVLVIIDVAKQEVEIRTREASERCAQSFEEFVNTPPSA